MLHSKNLFSDTFTLKISNGKKSGKVNTYAYVGKGYANNILLYKNDELKQFTYFAIMLKEQALFS